MYTVIHKYKGRTVKTRVQRKYTATDHAYCVVNSQGGTATVIPDRTPMVWGNYHVSRVCFYWRGIHILCRSTKI